MEYFIWDLSPVAHSLLLWRYSVGLLRLFYYALLWLRVLILKLYLVLL